MKTPTFSLFAFLLVLIAGCSKSPDSNDNTPIIVCTWDTVFYDDFQRTDTLLGSNYQAIIQPTPHGGHGFADIWNNSLRISSDSVFWAIVYNPSVDGSRTRVSVQCVTPASGGTCAFAVGGKFTNPGTTTQTGYLAAAMNNGIGIYKIVNGFMTPLASQAYQVQYNHTYKLSLTMNYSSLSAVITDEASGVSVTVTTTDGETGLSGKYYTLNGNSLGGQVVLLFDNFLLERCQ